MESTIAQTSEQQRKKDEFCHCDGSVPVCELHFFSLVAVCMVQTHVSCELFRCSDCCSMHKHISLKRLSLLCYSEASVTQG